MRRTLTTLFALTAMALVPTLWVLGAEYVPLSPHLPFISSNVWKSDFAELLDALVGISVGIAAVLAVIEVAIGGFVWMTSETPVKLGDAKDKIGSAIGGLLLVLVAILVLKTINPDLVRFDVFRSATNGTGGTGPTPDEITAALVEQCRANPQSDPRCTAINQL